MRHRAASVGNSFLAEKANGDASTDHEEDLLVLFAFQPAAAIANARTPRGEKQARSYLAALRSSVRARRRAPRTSCRVSATGVAYGR